MRICWRIDSTLPEFRLQGAEREQERWKEGKGAMERHEREASNGGILNSCLSAHGLIDGQGQASFPCQAKTSSCFRKQSWA